jgi:hypothetical protein
MKGQNIQGLPPVYENEDICEKKPQLYFDVFRLLPFGAEPFVLSPAVKKCEG